MSLWLHTGSNSSFESNTPGAVLAAQGQPQYTGIQLHTSTQATPIPIMWGTRRVAPNIIWMTPFMPNPGDVGIPTIVPGGFAADLIPVPLDVENAGGRGWTVTLGGTVFFSPAFKAGVAPGAWRRAINLIGIAPTAGRVYGTNDTSSSDCVWRAPMIMALCEGPIDDVINEWNGGGAQRQSVLFPALYNTLLKPPSLFYELKKGLSSQSVWDYFAAVNALTGGPYFKHDEDLAYRFTALYASAVVDCGTGLTPPQQSFEVVRTPNTLFRKADSYGTPGAFDYSPADFLPDLLTSLQYGMGLVSTDIDSVSIVTFTEYVFAQGIFMSPLLDSQKSGVDIINRWAIECNTWIYWDGSHIVFVPLGDETLTANGQTYTPDTTPAYNLGPNDFVGDLQVERADPVDCFNRVRLEFPDRLNNYAVVPIEWKDTTLINAFGIRDASSISADDICDVAVAAIVLDLAAKRVAYLRNTYSFTVGYPYIRILPGTIVTVSDPNLGLSSVPVRVRQIEEADDGGLAIVAEQYTGVLGIARPLASQPWTQSGLQGTAGGSTGGIGGSGTIGNGGNPVTGTYTVASTDTLILIAAGSTTNGLAAPLDNSEIVFRPQSGDFDQNPAKFVSTGTYTIEDPTSAGTYAAASTIFFKESATSYRFKFASAANKYVIVG